MQTNLPSAEPPAETLAFLTSVAAGETDRQSATTTKSSSAATRWEQFPAETQRDFPGWSRIDPWPRGGLNE